MYYFFRTLVIIFNAILVLAPAIIVCYWIDTNYSEPGQLVERGLAWELGFFYWPLLIFLGLWVSTLVLIPLNKVLSFFAVIYNKRQLTKAESKLSKFTEKNVSCAPFNAFILAGALPDFGLQPITVAEDLSLGSWPARSLGKFLAINDVTDSLAKNFEWQGDIFHYEGDFSASVKWTDDGPKTSISKPLCARCWGQVV